MTDYSIKSTISQYRYDHFFHHLIINNDELRLFLCQYVSQDFTIKTTIVDNSEDFHHHYEGKRFILDVVCRDEKGRYYNIEMQNGYIDESEQLRFERYAQRLVARQEKQGHDLTDIKEVFQLILYNGKPIDQFEHYVHQLNKSDKNYHIDYKGDKVKTTILQLALLKEENNMERQLGTMEQVGYLMHFNKVHENSLMDHLVEKIIDMHDEYMSIEEADYAYKLETERRLVEARKKQAKAKGREEGIHIGREEGISIGREEGITIGEERGKVKTLLQNVQTLIDTFYQEDAYDWLKTCNEAQLNRAFVIIKDHLTYEQFKEEILK